VTDDAAGEDFVCRIGPDDSNEHQAFVEAAPRHGDASGLRGRRKVQKSEKASNFCRHERGKKGAAGKVTAISRANITGPDHRAGKKVKPERRERE